MRTPQESARTAIDEALADLDRLLQSARDGDHNVAFELLRRWKTRTSGELASRVHPSEGARLSNEGLGMIRLGRPAENLIAEASQYRAFLLGLRAELEQHPDSVLAGPPPSRQAATDEPAVDGEGRPYVFIVHGHDELNLLRLKELLRDRWQLAPLVLAASPGKGRTLIEKFEEEAPKAVFAFVLLTPDDVVATGVDQYAQARPNVVFELGWFYGRLGRSRVCILFRRGTQIHSDLAGIVRIDFDVSVTEKLAEIEHELLEAKVLPQ